MKRRLVALFLGLCGACFVWIAAPINKHVLNNGLVSDSYFPEIAVLFMLVLMLLLNPLLKLISAKRLFIDARQLALIFGMLLVACTIPTTGLLRAFPYSLAKVTQNSAQNPQLAKIHANMQLPPSLFPDKIEYGRDTPNSTYLLEELPSGESIPWKAWIPPLISWGTLLIAAWALMIGLGMIVYPQWRDNERLPFPLLTLEQELIGGITSEERIPSIFKDKMFWLGCGLVLFLYSLNGISEFTGGKCPKFPLGWNISSSLSEEPWRHMASHIRVVPKIYFMLIGMAYFMPNRISFSIWFTTIVYSLYQMIGVTYFPPYDRGVITNHRHGATLAVGLMILFIGRRYWAKVGRNMFMRTVSSEERRNRVAGWLFVSGWAGIVAWLVWAGVHPGWAMALVFLCFLSTLVITRIVAETGLPFIRVTAIQSSWLVKLFPAGMISAPLIYIAGFLTIIFTQGSRMSPAVMTSHIMGLDKEITPSRQSRLPFLIMPILIIGLIVAGATHMNIGYRNFASMDGQVLTATEWGAIQLNGTESHALAWARDAHKAVTPKQIGQIATGSVIATILLIGCLNVSGWPLHPIGLLMVGHYYSGEAWASILIGWLAKTLILRYGGANTYRRFRNLFIGLILGELFAGVIWISVPVILILTGSDPTQIGHLTILPN